MSLISEEESTPEAQRHIETQYRRPTTEVVSESDSEEAEELIELARTPWTLVMRRLLVSSAINCLLPFVNGLMLGFGQIFAHELGFRWGWNPTGNVRSKDFGFQFCASSMLTLTRWAKDFGSEELK